MKTKRTIKIVTFTLTALLLFCAIVGITVLAAGTGATEVKIAGKNISYEGAPQILYYVQADGLADGQTVKVEIKHGDDEAYVKEVATDAEGNKMTATINGTTYYIVYSKGIAPKDMTKTVTAKAYIENADGTKVEAAESVDYSIYSYAMNRFSASPTADQVTLYTALLDYGAAVQEVFSQTDAAVAADIDKYGWADAYYDYSYVTYVDHILDYNASRSAGAKRPSEISAPEIARDYAGAKLASVKDNKGNSSSVNPALKPGKLTYTANYITGYNYNMTANSTVADYRINSHSFTYDTTGTASYMMVENDADKGAVLSAYGNGWAIMRLKGQDETINPVKGDNGTVFVLDLDMKYSGNVSDTVKQLGYFGMSGNDKSGSSNETNSNRNFAQLDLFASGENLLIGLNKNTTATITPDVWHNVRAECTVVDNNKEIVMLNGTAYRKTRVSVKIYVDGVLACSYLLDSSPYLSNNVVSGNRDPGGFFKSIYFEYGSGSKETNTKIDFANVYTAAYNKNADGVKYTFDSDTDVSDILSFKSNMVTIDNTSAKNYITVENGKLAVGTNGDGKDNWGCFFIKGPSMSEKATVGTKYVSEFDFTYVQGTQPSNRTDGRLAMALAPFTGAKCNSTANSHFYHSLFTADEGETLQIKSGTTVIATIAKNTETKLRYEYVIIETGLTTNYGILRVFVDGEQVSSSIVSTAKDTSVFENFYFEHNATDAKYYFDNLSIGVEYLASGGTTGRGAYYNKYLNGEITGAQVYDFDTDTILDKGSENSEFITSGTLNSYTGQSANVTADGHLRIGADKTWSQWDINGSKVTAAVGETMVFETDMLYIGGDENTTVSAGDGVTYFLLRNAAGKDIVNLRIKRGEINGATNGATITIMNTNVVMQKNLWYNLRVEIERTAEAKSTVRIYIDNVLAYTTTTTADTSALKGLHMELRVGTDGVPRQQYLFDNIVFDNISVNEAE